MRKDAGLEKLQHLEVQGKKKSWKRRLKKWSEVAGTLEESGIPKAKRRVLKQAQLLTLLSKIKTEKKNVQWV